MSVKITGKPTKTVANLTVTKASGSNKLTAKWKAGTQLTTPTSATRATGLRIQWVIARSNPKAKTKPKALTKTIETNTTATTTSSFNPNKFSITSGTGAKAKTTNFTRNSFYPVTNVRLTSVTCKVFGKNSVDVSDKSANRTYTFKKPGAPNVSDLTQAEDTGHICFTITPFDCSKNANERYWTEYKIYMSRCQPDATGTLVTTSTNTVDHFTGSAAAEWEDSDLEGKRHVDVIDRYAVGYDGYIEVKVSARSRGFAGDSKWTAAKRIVVSYPAKPEIGLPSVESTNGGLQDTGMVTFPVNTNQQKDPAKEYHPITGLRLQVLKNTTAETPAQAVSRGNEWDDTDLIDDGHCTAISASVADLKPTRGTRTWVRIKCWNQFEGKFDRYSDPIEVSELYLDPEAAGGTATITNVASGDDGTSLIADVEWSETGEVPSTGTELSWSADRNAWRSTEGPQTYEFTWLDERGGANDDFDGKAQVYIQGLEQGKTYYIRARRYYDDDEGERTYGAYSSTESGIPTSSPSSVVLNVPAFVARGSDVSLSWTFDSDAEQTEWQLLAGQTTGGNLDDGELTPREWDGETVIAMDGTDSTGSCVLSAERYEPLLADNQLSLSVRVGTGGKPVESEPVVFRVVDPPTLSMTVPATVTALSTFAIQFQSNVKARITLIARAGAGGNGGTEETPGRNRDQAEGDVVWQTATNPEWSGNGPFTTSISAPTDPTPLSLLDNGHYVVTASALDEETGLYSETVTDVFDVVWGHQAPAPDPDSIAVTPYDTTDEDGNRMRGCTVELYSPTGADETDVWDVYRLTPDGPYLIAEGLSQLAVVDDRYAPYGGEQIGYRVTTRTIDGDMDWVDIMYEAAGRDLRVDFGGEYVELPWDLSLSDSYQKDFEARRKLDGSIDGYWNDGVLRKGGFTTNLIRIREQDVAAAVRRLGRHVGPAFVRTPDGCAYQADVQVTDMSGARRDAALAVTLDVTEVGLTDLFRATLTDAEIGIGDIDDPDDDE